MEQENQQQFVLLLILLPAIKVAADDPFNSSITDFELMSETIKQAVENGKKLLLNTKKFQWLIYH